MHARLSQYSLARPTTRFDSWLARPTARFDARTRRASQFKEHAVLGGCAERLARQIEEETGCEARSVVLGHLQRGGSPVSFDRLLAQCMGCAAVRYLANGQESGMVAMIGGEIGLIPFEQVVGGTRGVDIDDDTVLTGRDLGICFGDRPLLATATDDDSPLAELASAVEADDMLASA